MAEDQHPSLVHFFVNSARRYPQRPALEVGSRQFSYDELFGRVSVLAGAIGALGEPRHALVGVLCGRNEHAFEGILAGLLAGHGYLPLNPTQPTPRLLNLFERVHVDTTVADESGIAALEPLLGELPPMRIFTPHLRDASSLRSRFPRHQFIATSDFPGTGPTDVPLTSSGDIAYLLFTSGSTGVPKGVKVGHDNINHQIRIMLDRFQLTPEDRFSQMFELTWDVSLFDMFASWGAGGCFCCVPPRTRIAPAHFIKEKELTIWYSVPSVAAIMRKMRLLKPNAFPTLRASLFAGEPLPLQSVKAWAEAAPNSFIENLYGPTEATIVVTAFHWDRTTPDSESPTGNLPMGPMLPGSDGAVVNPETLKNVPQGDKGEFVIGGKQIAKGYWDSPEEDERRFVAMPWMDRNDPANRWYRTGDLVYRDEQCGYHFLGRLDTQVKIMGHRVEMGEIETVLCEIAHTDMVAVLPWFRNESGYGGSVAFISGNELAEPAILERAKERLPVYMIPKRVHRLEHLPLNVNGKIDRKQLNRRLEEMDG